MNTIMCLPTEIIIHILLYENISAYDVKNFISTYQWKCAVDYNLFWKKKFFQSWPSLKKIYEYHMKDISFQEEVNASMECRKNLWCYLSQMSQKHYHRAAVSDINIKDFELLFDPEKHPMNQYFLLDELNEIIEKDGRQYNELDLTQTYYARTLRSYLKRYQQRHDWQELKNSTDQSLERAATILAQWCQPDKYIPYTYVNKLLDDIAQQVLEFLRKKYPAHSILSLSAEDFSSLKHKNIDNIQWNTKESCEIMNCIEDILNKQFKLIGYHSKKIYAKESFIDYTLESKNGTNLTISIIFASVAKRLGISCKIVWSYSHFLIWKSKELAATDSTNSTVFIFDMMKSVQEERRSHRIYPMNIAMPYYINLDHEINCTEMAERIIHDVWFILRLDIRIYWELKYLIIPDTGHASVLCEYYDKLHMDLSDIIIQLEKLQKPCNRGNLNMRCEAFLYHYRLKNKERAEAEVHLRTTIPKRRTKPLKFLIGEFVKFNKSVEGVIIGWDMDYDAYVAVGKLSSGPRSSSRPFYSILVKDTKYYIGEEKIVGNTKSNMYLSNSIRYKDLFGQYFSGIEETHSIPNEMLAYHYPDDFQMLKEKYNF